MNRRQISRLKVLPETKDALLAVHRKPSDAAKRKLKLANLLELMASIPEGGGSFSQERKAPSRTASQEGAQ